jgi:hypothetical protein
MATLTRFFKKLKRRFWGIKSDSEFDGGLR